MTDTTSRIGTVPHLPGALGRWSAISGWMPGDRLAALRIAAGLLLLFDMAATVWPYSHVLLSDHSLTAGDPFAGRFEWPHLRWSLSRLLPYGAYVSASVATLAALGLITGVAIRASAIAAYLGTVSLFNDNSFAHNGGDQLRSFLFLMLAVAPAVPWRSGALVPRWPLTVIRVQLSVMYGMNGIYKLQSPAWRDGTVMSNVLADLNWSLVPGLAPHIPDALMQAMTWTTLAWEVLFPLLILTRPTRNIALVLGVLFHVGTLLTLVVGLFPLYSLCLYVPFLPWERIKTRSQS
jgi:hypothetical protein